MLYHAIELFGAWDSREDIELNLDKVLEHKVSFWSIKFEQKVSITSGWGTMLVLDMSLLPIMIVKNVTRLIIFMYRSVPYLRTLQFLVSFLISSLLH
jgi:hypothetical protein